jgi:hypothetical protein
MQKFLGNAQSYDNLIGFFRPSEQLADDLATEYKRIYREIEGDTKLPEDILEAVLVETSSLPPGCFIDADIYFADLLDSKLSVYARSASAIALNELFSRPAILKLQQNESGRQLVERMGREFLNWLQNQPGQEHQRGWGKIALRGDVLQLTSNPRAPRLHRSYQGPAGYKA